ncbi:hypothetical protein U1Q18_051669 [Sarracenia purpurea var. burkii]
MNGKSCGLPSPCVATAGPRAIQLLGLPLTPLSSFVVLTLMIVKRAIFEVVAGLRRSEGVQMTAYVVPEA